MVKRWAQWEDGGRKTSEQGSSPLHPPIPQPQVGGMMEQLSDSIRSSFGLTGVSREGGMSEGDGRSLTEVRQRG